MGGTPPQPEGTADRHGRRRPALQSQEALPMAPARANPRPRLVTAAQPDADRPGTGLREVEAQIVEGAWPGASGSPPNRPAERRVGKELSRTVSSRGCPLH